MPEPDLALLAVAREVQGGWAYRNHFEDSEFLTRREKRETARLAAKQRKETEQVSRRNQRMKHLTMNRIVDLQPQHVEQSDELLISTRWKWAELDEMERMGWGNTPQTKIPADWREHRGPGR